MKEGSENLKSRLLFARLWGSCCSNGIDEKGQADTLQKRVDICTKAYEILTMNGFDPQISFLIPTFLQ
jgi:5-methyltetrahydrofolate--homocysteine methyltransferase